MSDNFSRRARARVRSRCAPRSVMFLATLMAVALLASSCSPDSAVNGSSNRSDGGPGAERCPESATILVDPSLVPVMDKVSSDYGLSFGGQCAPISIVSEPSRVVAQSGLGDADAWVPEGKTWQARSTVTSLTTAPAYSLGWSPLVLVAPTSLGGSPQGRATHRADLDRSGHR